MARLKTASTLDPVCRLICLVLFSTSSLAMTAPLAAVSIVVLFMLLAGEGIAVTRIIRDSSFLAGLIAFTVLLEGISFVPSLHLDRLGMIDAGIFGLRLVAAYLAGRLFYASTSNSELRDAATRICRRFPGGKGHDFGLVLALVLSFIPLIIDEWKLSLEAARARGLPLHPRLMSTAALLTAFLRRLMLRAVAVPEALSARGWSGTRSIPKRPWRAREYAACFVSLVFLGAATGLLPV